MAKLIYSFSESSRQQVDLLGGKGANLGEMTKIGLHVPQGFTITTKACLTYLEQKTLSLEVIQEIEEQILELEKRTGKEFGGMEKPLLVSVRSGAKISMPGMMDTILNLGMNDETVESLASLTQNPRFAYDSYRRLIQMFGDVVRGIDRNEFEDVLTKY